MPKKVNPHKIPRTQADVDRAKKDGILEGVGNACVIFLSVLVDKFNGAGHLNEVWREINKLSEEIKEGRVSIADLRTVLREEFCIDA